MDIVAYRIHHSYELEPAPLERSWMEATPDRFAYRCLPLNIANQHGWQIKCPVGFTAWWNGGSSADDLEVVSDHGDDLRATSVFGSGILTFPVPFLFRTEPGVQLQAMGPVNRQKDAIQPLTGIIETDWSPYTMTMNWRFTRPDTVIHFEAGEPYCFLFPLRLETIESVNAVMTPLSANQDLETEMFAWSASRSQFYDDLQKHGSQDGKTWQRDYFQGQHLDGRRAAVKHRTKVKTPAFRYMDAEEFAKARETDAAQAAGGAKEAPAAETAPQAENAPPAANENASADGGPRGMSAPIGEDAAQA